jgi:putative transposase
MQDKNSLAHTTWKCKYHIVFAPKYRRQIIYGKYKQSIGKILRELYLKYIYFSKQKFSYWYK